MKDPPFLEFVRAWNGLQHQGTPEIHRAMADWLNQQWHAHKRRLLLMAFRGAGKSTIVGLFVAWLLSLDPNTRIMVLAADLKLARKMVRNVKRIVEKHPACAGLKPKRPDQWSAEQFTVNRSKELRDPSVLAAGIDGNITGSRADVIVCDDVEVPNTSATEAARADLREKLNEADYVLTPDGTRLYVGTPHSFYSIYAKQPRGADERPFLDGYARYELPLQDRAGASAWPEKYPPEAIQRLVRAHDPARFASQMLLQAVDPQAVRLDPAKLIVYDEPLDYREANGAASLWIGERRMVSARCFWDPSYGKPKGGDRSALAAVFQDAAGHFWLHRIAYLEHDPARAADAPPAEQLIDQVVAFARDLHLGGVAVETNGIGKLLPGLLRRALDRAGLSDVAVQEEHQKSNKEVRLLTAIEPVLEAGRLHAHRTVLASPLIEEMRAWRPVAGRKRQSDDGLDALASCLIGQPLRLPARATPPRAPGTAAHPLRAAPTAAAVDFEV